VGERSGVGAADVHARAAADGLEALEHLDRGRVVIVGSGGSGGREKVGHSLQGIGLRFEPCQGDGSLNIHKFGVITGV
jgi:hypothetical protein